MRARGGFTAGGATSNPGPTTLDTGLRRYDGLAGVARRRVHHRGHGGGLLPSPQPSPANGRGGIIAVGTGEFTTESTEITEIGQGGILEGARRVHRGGRNTLPYTDPLDTGLRRYDGWAGVAQPPPCRRAQKFREGLNLWGCQCRVLGTI